MVGRCISYWNRHVSFRGCKNQLIWLSACLAYNKMLRTPMTFDSPLRWCWITWRLHGSPLHLQLQLPVLPLVSWDHEDWWILGGIEIVSILGSVIDVIMGVSDANLIFSQKRIHTLHFFTLHYTLQYTTLHSTWHYACVLAPQNPWKMKVLKLPPSIWVVTFKPEKWRKCECFRK